MLPVPPQANPGSVQGVDRLGVFKALGDDTRYAIFKEVSVSPGPVSTAELADRLGLHPNTIRPQLERMREVGLLRMSVDSHGAVGRPQHRWSAALDAPSLGLEPAGFRLLAHLLADAAAKGALSADQVRRIGASRGKEQAAVVAGRAGTRACLQRLVEQLADLGFDPAVDADSGDSMTVAFARCPFRELAVAFPDLVCQLHRGLTEGIAGGAGVEVSGFATLVDEDPCRVELSLR